MNEQLTHMASQVTAGKLTRREFMGKAAALGVSAAMASTVFADAARAAGAKKGGDLKLGLQGGESTSIRAALTSQMIKLKSASKILSIIPKILKR